MPFTLFLGLSEECCEDDGDYDPDDEDLESLLLPEDEEDDFDLFDRDLVFFSYSFLCSFKSFSSSCYKFSPSLSLLESDEELDLLRPDRFLFLLRVERL